jgi:serine/threonine protein kinase
VRGGGYSKETTPEKAQAYKYEQERLLSEKLGEAEGPFFKESPRRNLEKKLTPFEKEESRHFELLFVGSRRISSLADFTDPEGDPKVVPGDAIAYKYEVIALLGRGSFGRVFKAYDHKKKEYVALKIIKNQEKFTIQARVEIEIL